MATMVNTVTDQISSDALGKTLVHEHFAFGFPGFQGDTLGPTTRRPSWRPASRSPRRPRPKASRR